MPSAPVFPPDCQRRCASGADYRRYRFDRRRRAPEALLPLFDREVEGFGEVFRMLSFEEIGTATLQSRAIAGVANKTLILPCRGRPKRVALHRENIIAPQLDARTRPCNFHPI